MDQPEAKDPFSENSNAAFIAFHLFYNNYFAETQRNNPTLDNQRLHQLLCDKFSKLPAQEKQNYFARAAAELYISNKKKEKNNHKQSSVEDHFNKSNTVYLSQLNQQNTSNSVFDSRQVVENIDSRSSYFEPYLRNTNRESIPTEIHKQTNFQTPFNQLLLLSSKPFSSFADETTINQSISMPSAQQISSTRTRVEPNSTLLPAFYPKLTNSHQLLNEIEFKVNLSSSLSAFDSNCLLNYPSTFVKKKY